MNEANQVKLLPCPFCGGTDLDICQWVECNGCGAMGPTPEEEDGITGWNDRRGLVIELKPDIKTMAGPVLYADDVRDAITAAGAQVQVKP